MIFLLNKENEYQKIEVPEGIGSHAGGDKKLLEMMFSEKKQDDPLGQAADSFAGVVSAMIGIGANESIKSGATYDLRKAIDTLR